MKLFPKVASALLGVSFLTASMLGSIENVLAQAPESLVSLSARLNRGDYIKEVAKEYKRIGSIARTVRGSIEIEIISIETRDKGVEVLARAWENGEQIGFGPKGTIDKERFVIINPPALAVDPTGSIIRTDARGAVSRYKEDVQEALLQVLEHTISIRTRRFNSDNIIVGKVGNTTTTVFPEDGVFEDGRHQNSQAATWATVRGASSATNTNLTSNPQNTCGRAGEGGGTHTIDRFVVSWDTSSIGSDTVDSAIASLYGTSKENGDNDGADDHGVVAVTVADVAAPEVGDYNGFSFTLLSNAIDFGTLATDGYNDYTLTDPAGEAEVDTSGSTTLGWLEGHDRTNADIATGTNNEFLCNTVEASGTSTDPKLVVEHSVAAGGAVIFSYN